MAWPLIAAAAAGMLLDQYNKQQAMSKTSQGMLMNRANQQRAQATALQGVYKPTAGRTSSLLGQPHQSSAQLSLPFSEEAAKAQFQEMAQQGTSADSAKLAEDFAAGRITLEQYQNLMAGQWGVQGYGG